MITNLLNSIAKAWIKAEQARKEGKPEEIVNYIIRDIINNGCGLRIGSIIDYNPNQKEPRKYSIPDEEFIPREKIGIVTKMTVTYRPIAISVESEEGMVSKEIKAFIRRNPETGEEIEYEGIRVAERENNITRAGIRYAIIHNSICKGYKWRYKDEKYNNIKPKIKLDICIPPIIK